jgi:integrase
MDTEKQRRPRRRVLTDRMVGELPVREKTYLHPDPEMPSHGVRVFPTGARIFYVTRRDVYGKLRFVPIGRSTELKIEESRDRARDVIKRLKAGEAPFPPSPSKPDSLAQVVETYFKRHVEANGIRTGKDIRQLLDKHVLAVPAWRDREFSKIKRSDVAKLLDAIEDKHGAWIADAVLASLRAVSTWWIKRGYADDDYVSPFREIGRRVAKEKRTRSRILNDDELRRLWRTADELTAREAAALADPKREPVFGAAFGRFMQLSVLTAQRRDKLATMRWDDLDGDTWTIRTDARERGNAGVLKLPPLAMAIINNQKRLASSPYVFPAARGGGPISGFVGFKREFDKRAAVQGYSLHDLRRTARSLMSKAGIISEHAERVLGHALPGLEGTYNRFSYEDEKAHALERLASLIERIVNGEPGDNVLQYPRKPAS